MSFVVKFSRMDFRHKKKQTVKIYIYYTRIWKENNRHRPQRIELELRGSKDRDIPAIPWITEGDIVHLIIPRGWIVDRMGKTSSESIPGQVLFFSSFYYKL